MASSNALMRAAQAWCSESTKYTIMDPVLAEAFAEILDEEWKRAQPWQAETKDGDEPF